MLAKSLQPTDAQPTAGTIDQAIVLISLYHPMTLFPYWDSAGHWAIGWGSREMPDGSPVTEASDSIGPRAADLLRERLVHACAARVMQVVHCALSEIQISALVAFAYDLEADEFDHSPVVRLLNRGQIRAAAAGFGSYVRDRRGRVLPELVLRRAAQRRIFLHQVVHQEIC